MPFVPEADTDQQETPQRIYFYSYNRKGNGSVKGEIPLPPPNAEGHGIGQSEIWETPLKESREGLCDLFYETTSDPHDRAEGRIKEFPGGDRKTSEIGMERPTFPLSL